MTIPINSLFVAAGWERLAADGAAGRHLHPGLYRGLGRVEDALRNLFGQLAQPDAEQHGDERGRPVLRDLGLALLAEGVGRAVDVG